MATDLLPRAAGWPNTHSQCVHHVKLLARPNLQRRPRLSLTPGIFWPSPSYTAVTVQQDLKPT